MQLRTVILCLSAIGRSRVSRRSRRALWPVVFVLVASGPVAGCRTGERQKTDTGERERNVLDEVITDPKYRARGAAAALEGAQKRSAEQAKRAHDEEEERQEKDEE